MAAVSTEDVGIGNRSSLEVALGDLDQQCLVGESLAEWRSSEQLENGIPSTSPPYWDSDDEDDRGLKPPELYGKYTWKIDKFSQINKRELRSNAFEVGGYKWYILIYPQGCDVCNHLSLFLCVANHDKLLPGWSHFAQFTIAVVNKDPKKSKYSDTLHRFWKKEHDWGWKKFMELSKVFDGFIDADTLIIKAQVQVIRERADRPFRCLDCQYRRELIRVYLSNVEQICRRFVEERRSKLGKLIEDKARWSSFRAFWLSMDQSSRRLIAQEKTESILKVVVKQFFIEKEVTSTLVMDSLYSGLKALEAPCKGKKAKSKYSDSEELSIPIIKMERDMFMLIDDVLPLLERAVMEPLPPKDEKGPQNRMKDGATGEESNKDSIERDERRLTELGRRTIEIFILAHIFSKIEVAYQEAVALKKQEELIREEEAAWLAESEHKLRRGSVDKEKKSKKKQGKQNKRNNRKAKDKGKDEKLSSIAQVEMDQDSFTAKNKDFIVSKEEEGTALEKSYPAEDVSDVSDSADGAPERFHLDSEERDVNPVNWDTDNSEARLTTEASSSGISGLTSMPNGIEGKKPSVLDDTSSTSSSDSVPSVILNMPNASNPHHQKDKKSSSRRGRNLQGKKVNDSMGWAIEENRQPSETGQGAEYPKVATRSSMGLEAVPSAVTHPSREMILDTVDMRVKDDSASCMPRNISIKESEPSGEAAAVLKLPSRSPSKEASSIPTHKSVSKVDIANSSPVGKKSSWSGSPGKSYVPLISAKSAENLGTSEVDSQNSVTPRVMEKTSDSQKLHMDQVSSTTGKLAVPIPVVSRPYSAPLIPSSKVAVSTVQTVPASPTLSRSSSAACSLGPESPASAATQSYVPLSYRNAIMGGPMNGSSFVPSYHQNNHSTSSVANSSVQYSQVASLTSTPLYSQFSSDRMEMKRPTLSSFGMASHHDMLPTARPLWTDTLQSRNLSGDIASESSDMLSFDLYSTYRSRSQDNSSSAPSPSPVRRQTHVSADEFPHLDIINDLLDDENVGVSNSCSLSDSDCHGFRNAHSRSSAHLMNENQLYSNFPLDTTSPGPSAGVCRFERTRSFSNERFQYSYPAMGTSQEAAMGHHGGSPRPHYNNGGQVSVLVPPSQWQMGGGAERGTQFLNGRSSENDGYLYRLMEYQNLSSSNGFPVYRPSNGM